MGISRDAASPKKGRGGHADSQTGGSSPFDRQCLSPPKTVYSCLVYIRHQHIIHSPNLGVEITAKNGVTMGLG